MIVIPSDDLSGVDFNFHIVSSADPNAVGNIAVFLASVGKLYTAAVRAMCMDNDRPRGNLRIV